MIVILLANRSGIHRSSVSYVLGFQHFAIIFCDLQVEEVGLAEEAAQGVDGVVVVEVGEVSALNVAHHKNVFVMSNKNIMFW